MALKDRLNEDIKNALKEGNPQKVSTLRQVLSAARNKEFEKRTKLSKGGVTNAAELEKQSVLTDDEVMDVILSEIKKRRDSIESFIKGSRQDLVQSETQEMEILLEYAPKQLSEGELREIVKKKITELNIKEPKEMGKLMGAIMFEYKGRVDGSRIKKIIDEIFSNGT